MFYLICYDIVSDARRNRVAKLLERKGMRVQKSVFEAVLNETQYEQLQKQLLKLLNQKEDQLRFYPLSTNCRENVTILGIQPTFAIDDSVIIV